MYSNINQSDIDAVSSIDLELITYLIDESYNDLWQNSASPEILASATSQHITVTTVNKTVDTVVYSLRSVRHFFAGKLRMSR